MQTPHDNSQQHRHHVRMDAAGRVVIPAELRQRWQMNPGQTLHLIEEPTGVRLKTTGQLIQESQEYFKQFIPPGVSLVDELLAERRAEAARE